MIRKNSAARTFLCLLLAFVFAASCLPQTIFATTDKKTVTTWPEGPENNSGAVCLLDADTGAVLYDKNMDEQRYPASITKILTAHNLITVLSVVTPEPAALITQEFHLILFFICKLHQLVKYFIQPEIRHYILEIFSFYFIQKIIKIRQHLRCR